MTNPESYDRELLLLACSLGFYPTLEDLWILPSADGKILACLHPNGELNYYPAEGRAHRTYRIGDSWPQNRHTVLAGFAVDILQAGTLAATSHEDATIWKDLRYAAD